MPLLLTTEPNTTVAFSQGLGEEMIRRFGQRLVAARRRPVPSCRVTALVGSDHTLKRIPHVNDARSDLPYQSRIFTASGTPRSGPSKSGLGMPEGAAA